ncbi:MAG TPA: Fe(2+)-trafficking protein [Tepidisphaeraceae bacterium]|jgi:Fe-S cluster biosynthesis and repair protein YggX|nr:Fe(2+)-trafficking protein [Tepidisphaeraceae bacterium]
MADTSRLEQFRKMANDDPTNELAHLSLGKAYLDAGQAEEAVASLDRAIELNPKISKAYQLAGAALEKLGRKSESIDRLTRGVTVADERGERQARDEMAASLTALGAPVPAFAEKSSAAVQVGEGKVLCKRCGEAKPSLPKPPFSNPQGRQIFENVCADCWNQWIRMGTKVINELRLPLNDPQAQKVYDQHMAEFLNLK